jgi:hypothetical protein
MKNQTKKTVTVKLTASEAEWLTNRLLWIQRNEKSASVDDQYTAKFLVDRIRSES